KRFPGLNGNHLYAGRVRDFERLAPNYRDVKTEILTRLRYFNDNGALLSQRCATTDRLIRPFESFNGEHRTVPDDNSLADVQAADLFGDLEPVFDVVKVAVLKFWTSDQAVTGQCIFHVGSRRHQL